MAERAYEYQKSGRFFAQTADGLEALAGAELEKIGATGIKPGYRGVYFNAGHDTLYRINYTSRLVTRVIAPLLTFDCHSTHYLYKTARSIDWREFFGTSDTFAVFANALFFEWVLDLLTERRKVCSGCHAHLRTVDAYCSACGLSQP